MKTELSKEYIELLQAALVENIEQSLDVFDANGIHCICIRDLLDCYEALHHLGGIAGEIKS